MEANLPLNEISEPFALVSERSGAASEFMFGLFSLASANEFRSVNISHYFPLLTFLSLHRPGGSVYSLHVSQNIQHLTIFFCFCPEKSSKPQHTQFTIIEASKY